jgi:hypothetical protein
MILIKKAIKSDFLKLTALASFVRSIIAIGITVTSPTNGHTFLGSFTETAE